MLSLKLIRDEPDRVRAALASRNDRSSIDEILEFDAKRRALQTRADELRHRRNAVSEQISKMKQKPPELIQEMRDVGARIKELDRQIDEREQQVNRLVLYLPNIPDPSVPVAPDESGNVQTTRWGTPRAFSFR